MDKGRIFEAKNEFGETVECEVVMSYMCYENGNSYVFYTDNTYDYDGELNLYASRYLGEDNGNMILEDIEDESEWLLLDKVLDKAKEGLEDNGK